MSDGNQQDNHRKAQNLTKYVEMYPFLPPDTH